MVILVAGREANILYWCSRFQSTVRHLAIEGGSSVKFKQCFFIFFFFFPLNIRLYAQSMLNILMNQPVESYLHPLYAHSLMQPKMR